MMGDKDEKELCQYRSTEGNENVLIYTTVVFTKVTV